ncbi:MAG: endonuclease III [Chloroflexi bacterium]|nr:endonuclease III [Chloroflexota bacterium]
MNETRVPPPTAEVTVPPELARLGITAEQLAAWRAKALAVHQRLLEHYGEPRLPRRSPLDELMLTILSQNTNDRNRDRAYAALRQRFPTWEEVRDADPEAVVDAIRVAGLANQKGPRLQAVLRAITRERGNLDLGFLADLPLEKARQWLLRFKGVGPKTAAIVLLFALGKPAFPVDTHIYRVTGRLGLRPPNLSVEKTHILMEHIFPPETYAAAHLNLIRLGRDYCHPRKPRCDACPVRDLCDYAAAQAQPEGSP